MVTSIGNDDLPWLYDWGAGGADGGGGGLKIEFRY